MKNYKSFAAIVISIVLTSSPVSAFKQNNESVNVEFLNAKPANAALPFSEAVKVGETLYLSGQIAINPETRKLAVGGIKPEAEQILKNIDRTLNQYGYKKEDVVKCLVILTDIEDFSAFNEVYASYFKPPYPARSAFAASELALGAKVEIECIAAK